MKLNVAAAVFIAVGATAVGAGALDRVPSLYGSESIANLTLAVLNQCTALHSLSDPISYYGGGSATGEAALTVAAGATQMIAPMSRPLGSGICSVPGPTREGANGLVLALDAVSVTVNSSTVGAEGIDYVGSAGDPQNQSVKSEEASRASVYAGSSRWSASRSSCAASSG